MLQDPGDETATIRLHDRPDAQQVVLTSLLRGRIVDEVPYNRPSMSTYIAFLRAINVGGHTVKMERLRAEFEALGLESVETFIASGNVIFQTKKRNARNLERTIEERLRSCFGYAVDTFLRSPGELALTAGYPAFTRTELEAPGATLYIAFLHGPPSAEAERKLMTFRTETDDFTVHGREIYYLVRTRLSESRFSGAVLERTLGQPATMRNVSTVKKLAEKYRA